MPSRFFITGTDTNVGKTVLSALLTAALDGVYWKPVQSGASEGTDRETVMRLAGICEGRTRPEIYCFDAPVSPHLAARLEGAVIELNRIQWPDDGAHESYIVEGAGGVLVPLNERETMLDLIVHLALPAIVATRTSLGTINHTLLTLAALAQADVKVRGVVMLGEENIENRRAIEHYGKVPVIGRVPWLNSISRNTLLEVFNSRFQKDSFG